MPYSEFNTHSYVKTAMYNQRDSGVGLCKEANHCYCECLAEGQFNSICATRSHFPDRFSQRECDKPTSLIFRPLPSHQICETVMCVLTTNNDKTQIYKQMGFWIPAVNNAPRFFCTSSCSLWCILPIPQTTPHKWWSYKYVASKLLFVIISTVYSISKIYGIAFKPSIT